MASLPPNITYGSPNVTVRGYNPTPGPQQPGKYPVAVGPAYQYYGEQQGYIYSPYQDTYTPDPAQQHAYYQQAGLEAKPPKQPSTLSALGPGLLGIGAAAATASAFKDPSKFFGGIGNLISGGSGTAASGTPAAAAPVAGAPAAASAAPAAAPAASSSGTGFFGLGNLFGGGGSAPSAPSLISAANAGPGTPALLNGVPVTQGGSGLLGLTGASPLLGAAGLAAGAATAYESFKGLGHALKGEKLSLPEQAALALPTFGLSFAYNSLFAKKHEWKQEKNRLNKLSDKGTFVPQELIDSMPQHARSKDELVRKDKPADFIGRDEQGNWVNNKFAQSRNKADLRPEDIVNYSAFAENDPDWFHKPLDARLQVANQALQADAVDEHHGTISVDFKKVGAASPQQIPPQSQGQPQPTPQPSIPKPLPQPLPPVGNAQPKGAQTVPGSQVTYGSLARSDAQPAPAPAKGSRISPGVYADGKGGAYKKK